jgi:malate dehydrogenase (oxaloacetate-decarboxylating)(NADP+)
MKVACVDALAKMAQVEASDLVVAAYGGEPINFGPEYLIPKPFDPRLIAALAPAVARAAMESGVASRPIEDLDAYEQELHRYVFKSVLLMRPVFERARQQRKRLVYAEGEDPRILQAVQTVVDEGLALPVLIGRPAVIEARIQRLGLRLDLDDDVEIVNPESDTRFREYSSAYYELMKRKGVSPEDGRTVMRTQTTAIAAVMMIRGEADALLCGATGRYPDHVRFLIDVIGRQDDNRTVAALNVVVLNNGTYFLADTQVNAEPNAEQVAEITLLTVEQVRRFGMEPKVALVSHSNFGSSHAPGAEKMRAALKLILQRAPDLEVDGEMQADSALLDDIRDKVFPQSRLRGEANVLIMPNLDSANIALNLLNVLSDAVTVGPILLGLRQPAHVLNPSSSVRRIVNMSALAAAEAQMTPPQIQLNLPS